MNKLNIGQKVSVSKTIPGQFYTHGIGIIKNIERGIAQVDLSTARGLWGQLHKSTYQPVGVLARINHIKEVGHANI